MKQLTKQHRLAMGAMPVLLREILTGALGSQGDMKLVGDLTSESDRDSQGQKLDGNTPSGLGVDVLIVGDTDASEIGRLFLHPCLPVRILSITDHGRAVFLHELRPRHLALGEISLHGLAEVIRGPVSRSSLA